MNTPTPALITLTTMQERMAQLRQRQLSEQAFSDWARQQHTLLQALPPQFDTVLQDLLNRLEASALFAEESCSFSQTDLHDSLQLWLDKARSKLESPT